MLRSLEGARCTLPAVVGQRASGQKPPWICVKSPSTHSERRVLTGQRWTFPPGLFTAARQRISSGVCRALKAIAVDPEGNITAQALTEFFMAMTLGAGSSAPTRAPRREAAHLARSLGDGQKISAAALRQFLANACVEDPQRAKRIESGLEQLSSAGWSDHLASAQTASASPRTVPPLALPGDEKPAEAVVGIVRDASNLMGREVVVGDCTAYTAGMVGELGVLVRSQC